VVRLYLDEDVNILLATLLRSRNISVVTTVESKMRGTTDEEQLRFATRHSLSIVTHNRIDFENLFRDYFEEGKNHSGIIVLIRRNVYAMTQKLSRFALTHDYIYNELWYV
jgi:predicted nuclease of predicted toxin-antitoxin system